MDKDVVGVHNGMLLILARFKNRLKIQLGNGVHGVPFLRPILMPKTYFNYSIFLIVSYHPCPVLRTVLKLGQQVLPNHGKFRKVNGWMIKVEFTNLSL